MVFSNKVLLVSLLVLGLLLSQPSQGEARLEKRVAGGFAATTGQFPFIVRILYPLTDGTFQQGTGVIYDSQLVMSSNQVFQRINPSNTALAGCLVDATGFCPVTITQGVTDVNNQQTTNTISKLVYVDKANPANVIKNYVDQTSTATDYLNDLVVIQFALSANGAVTGFPTGQNLSIRRPTSSLTQADIGKTYVIGFGEIIPGTQPAPTLNYVKINPMNFHKCSDLLVKQNIGSSVVNFNNTFCLFGAVEGENGGLSDACVTDYGGAIIRTQNINSPVADYEVVGILAFGSCQASSPAIASYVFKVADVLGAQVDAPAAGSPANSRSFDGNFACGDSVVQSGQLEKCDFGLTTKQASKNTCCNVWTCQLRRPGSACGALDGFQCRSALRCNGTGFCKRFNRGFAKGSCNDNVSYKTRCFRGQCCKADDRTECVTL
jgi:hypothetical protein